MSRTRMTKQRAVILDVLRSATNHPTADEVYAIVREKIPRVSLGTVYRNLDLLAGIGEINKIECGGSQKRFDGNIQPHFHVRCGVCGKLGDIFHRVAVPSAEGLTASGFTLHNADVTFNGVCDFCNTQC